MTKHYDESRFIKGRVHIKAWERLDDGTEIVVKDTIFDNLIVDVGKDSILRRLGDLACGGFANGIGVGTSTCCPTAGDIDLLGSCKLFKTISTCNKTYVRPTLFLTADFGFSEANFTWNEVGLRDDAGSPKLWARQIDGSPLIKTSSKRAIVEWQLSV